MQIDNFHINDINIINYKKYTSLNLNLNNQFMLIIGENGSGKTSVLDAIATLLGGYLQAFKDIPAKERHSITKPDIKIDIFDKDNNISVKYNNPVVISGNCNINNKSIFIERERRKIDNNGRTDLLKSKNIDLFNIIKIIEEDNENILPIISYLKTSRLWEVPSQTRPKMEKLTKFDGYKDCLNQKSNNKNFILWFAKMEFNSFQINKKIPILETVRETIIKMLSMLTQKEIELFIYREDDLEIKYKDEEKRERVSSLSDGYKNMLLIVSDIAYRMAILNPNLGLEVIEKTSGVVLIDEIDLHLHPKWQKEIVNILTTLFPKVQFVVTSHSPFIIQSLRSGSIIKLDESSVALDIDATELSIDDITEDIQKIPNPQMSSRKKEMLNKAKEYFEKLELLEKGNISKEEVNKIKDELDDVSALYDDNMAYVAFLERKRLISESKQ